MTMAMKFQTPKGAEIELIACLYCGFNANINGEQHTSSVAAFCETDPQIGPHISLAGKIKAQIPAERVEDVKAFFAAAKKAQADAFANRDTKLTAWEASVAQTEKMNRRDSRY